MRIEGGDIRDWALGLLLRQQTLRARLRQAGHDLDQTDAPAAVRPAQGTEPRSLAALAEAAHRLGTRSPTAADAL